MLRNLLIILKGEIMPGTVIGYVRDDLTLTGVSAIVSSPWGNTQTDADGYYYLPMEDGTFTLTSTDYTPNPPCYYTKQVSVTVNNNTVVKDIYMRKKTC